MKYWDEKFYWTYQRSVGWPNDYIGLDSMTRWIIEKSQGFTDVGLLRISESVRTYAFLILSSQASARSSIVGNTASALTALTESIYMLILAKQKSATFKVIYLYKLRKYFGNFAKECFVV